MDQIELAASFEAPVIKDTKDNPTWGVIWLHGLGADGHDFESIVPELVEAHWPGIRFVFPHAPKRPVTINGGMRMRAWYDITSIDRKALGEAPGLRDSIQSLEHWIKQLKQAGIASERVILAGFSQGGAVILSALARSTHRFAGAMALSCYMPLADSLAAEKLDKNLSTPIFIAHGSQDPVVPFALGLDSAKVLREQGYKVQWHTYSMPHSLSGEEILDLRFWMSGILSA
jgi:phospholipase/carboxylesterase